MTKSRVRFVYTLIFRPPIVIRFLQAGGVAAAVDLLLLYFFTDLLGLWYLASATIALAISLLVSFLLQKFWTFRSRDLRKRVLLTQSSLYLSVWLANLALNTVLMYIFVDQLGLWYLLAQILACIIIAASNFFIYQKIIFRQQ